jgi:enoyl-[acyl-carrier-protein] reductase (NADH)
MEHAGVSTEVANECRSNSKAAPMKGSAARRDCQCRRAFLASDAAALVTGQGIMVDGGLA